MERPDLIWREGSDHCVQDTAVMEENQVLLLPAHYRRVKF